MYQAVNRMAQMLASYESEVRRTERIATLAPLGGGVAHQIRNSVTGQLIALDLHSEECSTGRSCESLHVARRQLQLMEEYIRRFPPASASMAPYRERRPRQID